MSPAGVVAIKLLRALRVTTVAEAKLILAQWAARPRLSPRDIRDVLGELDSGEGGNKVLPPDERSGEFFDPSEFPPRGTVRYGEHDYTGGAS